MPLINYRWVSESCGSRYDFPPDQSSHIGTFDCQTCVGVYFAFQDETCFCAHINPLIDVYPGEWARIPHGNEGERLRELVCGLLNHHCGPASELKRDREVIVVCPQLYESKWGSDPAGWVRQTGWFTVEGIREWLAGDREDPKRFVCDELSQGFVVDHRNGRVAKIPTNVSRDEVVGGVTLGDWHVVPEEMSLSGQLWEPSVRREMGKGEEERRPQSL